jgi:hypothetical protein
MAGEQAQIDALKADMTSGRRAVYEKIEGVEDRLADLKTEVHGLVIRAEEREARHNERHAELRTQIRELADGFKAHQASTATFNRELIEAVKARNTGPSGGPPDGPPPIHVTHTPIPKQPTFADQLNALDWRWVMATLIAIGLVSGSLTLSSGAADRLVSAVIPNTGTATAAQPAPAAP